MNEAGHLLHLPGSTAFGVPEWRFPGRRGIQWIARSRCVVAAEEGLRRDDVDATFRDPSSPKPRPYARHNNEDQDLNRTGITRITRSKLA